MEEPLIKKSWLNPNPVVDRREDGIYLHFGEMPRELHKPLLSEKEMKEFNDFFAEFLE